MNGYDAVVAGAGPAGCAYALALTARGARVLLAGPEPRHPSGTLELVNGLAMADLTALGLLGRVQAAGRLSAGSLSRWGAAEFAARSSLLDPAGPGWIVDRDVLDAGLRVAAQEAGIRVANERLARPARRADGWTAVLTRSGRTVHGRLLVVATGCHGRGWIPACPSAERNSFTVAITGWFRDGLPGLGDRLLVDAGLGGWWYALGSPAGVRVTYCLAASRLPPPGPARVGLAWRAAARRAGWVPSLDAASSGVRSTPVRLTACAVPAGTTGLAGRLEPAGQPGWLAIGDAALSVSPLSGHGVALALRGAVLAAEDPARYQEWLLRTALEHAAEEARLHAAAGGQERRAGPVGRRPAVRRAEIRNVHPICQQGSFCTRNPEIALINDLPSQPRRRPSRIGMHAKSACVPSPSQDVISSYD
jgi:2-polyprenyl-6-methoxyphenol hydroxylase-like FAD-dependent oxidoreductase